MELISVIVPIYKVEKYLDHCIESIVNQTYKNLEIILVDDGSPDRCPEICEEWALKDNRIKVIHQKNSGSGQARNVALDVASGEFIGFVDSDDFISEYMYERLHSYAVENVDVVECQIISTESDNIDFDYSVDCNVNLCSKEEALKLHIEDKLFRQTPPNKLYRRTTISDIRFPVGKLIDDEFWTYRVLGNARNLISITSKMYAYRQQSESVMHKCFSLQRLQAIEAKSDRLNYLSYNFPNLVSLAKLNLQMTCFFLGQMSLRHLDKKQCEEAFALIDKVRKDNDLNHMENNNISFKSKMWLFFSRISFRGTCILRNVLRRGI